MQAICRAADFAMGAVDLVPPTTTSVAVEAAVTSPVDAIVAQAAGAEGLWLPYARRAA